MKRLALILVAIIAVTFSAMAQRVKKNEVDKFTKKAVIETSFEKINTGNALLNNKSLWISFKKNDTVNFLRLKWLCNCVTSISKDAEIIFLDTDGETYSFSNSVYTISGEGEGTVGFVGSALLGLDIWLTGDLSALEGKKIEGIRIPTSDGYVDFKISGSASKKIAKTYSVFKEAVYKSE